MIPALVPVRRLAAAKSRLAQALGRPAAERLATAMLEDVVAALRAVPRLGPVAVVTPDPAVAETARRSGASPLLGPDPGLNACLERGAREIAWRAAALLVVLGDVAGVRAADVEALLDALAGLGGRGVVLAPSSDGGTAALLRAPPDAIGPHFGAQSARAHRQAARAAQVPCRELPLPSLAIDLDSEQDLHAFLAGPGDGPRTRALLRELGFGTSR